MQRKKTAKSASSSTLFKRSKLPPGTLSSSNQLILSPSLQAIISSHTHPQQPKPPKKENSRSHDGISGKSICVKEFSSKTPITLVTKNISPKGLSRGPISLVPCRPPTDKPLGKMEASTSSKERVGEGVDIVKELTAEASSGSKGPSRGALASKLQSQGPGQVKEPAAESSSKTLSKALAEDPVKGAGKASETTSKGPPETKPSNKGAEVNKSQVKGSESNKTQVKGSESNKTQVKGSETTKTPVKGSETTKTPVKGSEATKTPVKGTDMKGKVLEKSESSSKKSCMEKKTPGKESPIENKGLTRSRAGKAMDRSKNKTTLESGSDGITSPAAASDSGKQQPSPGSPSSSEETSSPERSDRDHHQKTSPFQQQQQQLQQDEKKVWRSSPPSHGISPPSLPSVASALLCSETLPGLLPKHHSSPPTSSVSSATAATTPTAATAATALSALAEPAAHSLLSLSVSAGPFVPPPTTAPSPSTNKPELPSQQQEKKLDSVDSSSTSSSGINSMDGLECGEEHKCLDSASDGEGSPSPTHHHAPCNTSKPLASNSPDSKRKWRTETVEEYQCRKKARHADMNYTLDFSEFTVLSV